MGLLDGGLQRVVSGVFGGLLLTGELHRLDGRARALSGKVANTWAPPIPIKGVDAEVTSRMAQAPGATAKDAQLIILQIDANGSVITPELTEADEVTVRGVRWKLGMITSDPAKGAWIMRGTPTEPPPPPPA